MATHFLERDTCSEDQGVFGILTTADGYQCQTVEQPWRDNEPFRSCVPVGVYTLRKFNSLTHGATYALESQDAGVAVTQGEVNKYDHLTRYACILHKANLSSELRGCIAPGRDRWFYKDHWAISSSGDALDDLLKDLHDGDSLIISWVDVFL